MSNSPVFPYWILNVFSSQIFESQRLPCMLSSQTNWLRASKSLTKGLILQRSWALSGCTGGTGSYGSQDLWAYVQYPARSSKYFKISHEKCNLSSVIECWYELLNHFWSVGSNFLQHILLSWNTVSRSDLHSMRHSTNPEQALPGWLCEDRREVPGRQEMMLSSMRNSSFGVTMAWSLSALGAILSKESGCCAALRKLMGPSASCSMRQVVWLLYSGSWPLHTEWQMTK